MYDFIDNKKEVRFINRRVTAILKQILFGLPAKKIAWVNRVICFIMRIIAQSCYF